MVVSEALDKAPTFLCFKTTAEGRMNDQVDVVMYTLFSLSSHPPSLLPSLSITPSHFLSLPFRMPSLHSPLKNYSNLAMCTSHYVTQGIQTYSIKHTMTHTSRCLLSPPCCELTVPISQVVKKTNCYYQDFETAG